MERKIGQSGISVFPIGLGAMPLSRAGRPDEKSAIGVIEAALESGVTLIDTSNAYCLDESERGHNERLIAEALKQLGARDSVLVATKGGHTRPGGDWVPDGRPAEIRRACEQSLRDLDVEAITLYQFHKPDPNVPFMETFGEFVRLREEGKVVHLGLSNVTAAQLREAQAEVPVVSVQNRLNPIDRDDVENGMVDACAEAGVAYIPYGPVGGGGGHVEMAAIQTLAELAAK